MTTTPSSQSDTPSAASLDASLTKLARRSAGGELSLHTPVAQARRWPRMVAHVSLLTAAAGLMGCFGGESADSKESKSAPRSAQQASKAAGQSPPPDGQKTASVQPTQASPATPVAVPAISTSTSPSPSTGSPMQTSNAVIKIPASHSLTTYGKEHAATATSVELATFAAGCFWSPEASFRKMPGVFSSAVGYAGGHVESPTYKQVCTDETGHAEVVQVAFDPKVVTFNQLVDAFFAKHDPTQVNRQGPDVGSQYRTAIFFHNDQQKTVALAAKETLDKSGKFRRPLATQIAPVGTFWPAEVYHQQYLEKRGLDSCGTGH